MSKLLPPKLPSALPAFMGDTFYIPIEMNGAVGFDEISGFTCYIKTALSNDRLGTIKSVDYIIRDRMVQVNFILPKEIKLNLGQFYKVQLAYNDISGAQGIFSTVGIMKYCDTSSVQIQNFEAKQINNFTGQFTGVYNSKDSSEKVYSYKYNLYDEFNNIVDTSGELIHNTSNDVDSFSSESYFQSKINLEDNKIYYIKYFVTTVNNLYLESPTYKVMRRQTLPSDLEGDLVPVIDNENGCISLYLEQNTKSMQAKQQAISGAFAITRLNLKTNVWDEIFKFNFFHEIPFRLLFKDFTIEQGIEYLYAIQQYNDSGLYSDKIFATKTVQVDFEDMFLFDGKRQLRIRFNPKMTSFKKIVLEQKINTIGSKYPFIFKNGNVGYKEFPISGLLSYKEDEAESFVKWYQEFKDNPYDINLSMNNISLEREFKLAILEWLTDGKPKLFRSPTEGNYIVRLLNVSLAPIDKVGRMLHTFNSMASEVASYSYESLKNFHLTGEENAVEKITTLWKTISLQTILPSGEAIYKEGKLLNGSVQGITSLSLKDMTPGDKITLTIDQDDIDIIIGATGTYEVNNVNIKEITIPAGSKYQGLITYSTKATIRNRFSLIKDIFIKRVPAKQFCCSAEEQSVELISKINNIKVDLLKFYQIRFYKNYLVNEEEFNKFIRDDFNIIFIYNNGTERLINIYDMGNYTLSETENLKSIQINKGVIAEAAYSFREKEYFLESENANVKEAKDKYLLALTTYKTNLQDYTQSTDIDNINELSYEKEQKNFISVLNTELQNYKEDNYL